MECPICNGTGYEERESSNKEGKTRISCPRCGATGDLFKMCAKTFVYWQHKNLGFLIRLTDRPCSVKTRKMYLIMNTNDTDGPLYDILADDDKIIAGMVPVTQEDIERFFEYKNRAVWTEFMRMDE